MVSSASVFSTAKWLEAQSLLFKAVAVLFGSLILTAGSYITVPMVPVPITMQTFAITVVGAVYGWRLGGLTVLFWLMQGALGLPVFAPGAVGGIARFFGPTGGYLFSFPICAMLTGWMVEHGFSGRSFVKGFLAMLAGNILCLIIGGAWLAVMMGFAKGMALGVTAFIAGAFTKSVLGAAVLLGISGYEPEAQLRSIRDKKCRTASGIASQIQIRTGNRPDFFFSDGQALKAAFSAFSISAFGAL